MNRKLNRNLIILMRCLLFVIGALIGSLAMWQFLLYHPDRVNNSLKVVFYISSGLVLALVLMLSTTPILHLCYGVGAALKKIFGMAKPMNIAGIMIGVIVGIMIAYLCEALLSLAIKIISVRIVIDIIVGVVATYVACLLCTKTLSGASEESEELVYNGFILTSSALASEKIVSLCTRWLSGNFYVLSKSINFLIDDMKNENSATALNNYKELSENGVIETIQTSAESPEIEDIINFATVKSLKIIVLTMDEVASCDNTLNVLALDTI